VSHTTVLREREFWKLTPYPHRGTAVL
jgi:hypothetical protein